MIFHNALDIAEIVRRLQEEGRVIDPEDLAHISPYLTEHIRRFGECSTHELGLQPEAYDPHLDVDFSPLRGDGPRRGRLRPGSLTIDARSLLQRQRDAVRRRRHAQAHALGSASVRPVPAAAVGIGGQIRDQLRKRVRREMG